MNIADHHGMRTPSVIRPCYTLAVFLFLVGIRRRRRRRGGGSSRSSTAAIGCITSTCMDCFVDGIVDAVADAVAVVAVGSRASDGVLLVADMAEIPVQDSNYCIRLSCSCMRLCCSCIRLSCS
jgi:hypothetical protein